MPCWAVWFFRFYASTFRLRLATQAWELATSPGDRSDGLKRLSTEEKLVWFALDSARHCRDRSGTVSVAVIDRFLLTVQNLSSASRQAAKQLADVVTHAKRQKLDSETVL
jgi:hypothetical protein